MPNKINLEMLEKVQNRLVANMAKDIAKIKELGEAAADDWVQGGWSRGSTSDFDELKIGISPKEHNFVKPLRPR